MTKIKQIVVSCFMFMSSMAVVFANTDAPNIVFVLMDDLGWFDVSFNGGQFPTPNIDALWAESVELKYQYVHLMCSPSRTQFLTGRYAMYQGIGKMLPWDYYQIGGIPAGQPTIADWLKSLSGYSTYAVGKWHCGYAYEGLLPTSKGFDHFFGFYQGAIHYDTMQYIDIRFGDEISGDHYDFWEDAQEAQEVVFKPQLDTEPRNTMYLYRDKVIEYIQHEAIRQQKENTPFYMYIPLQTIHGPLEFVPEYQDQCNDIIDTDINRIKYCHNMLLTDDVIGAIMDTLKDTGFWDNTLFVLTTDNGAELGNKGCNFPLRGTKGTPFDGNIRVITLVGGGIIPESQRGTYRNALFSALDWTPTLLHFAHQLRTVDASDVTWDGVDQHDLIMRGPGVNGENIMRDHIVFNIRKRNLDSASIVFKMDHHLYKYIALETEDEWRYLSMDGSGWCVPEGNGDWNIVHDDEVVLGQAVDGQFLFDLTFDISERTNLLQLNDRDASNMEIIDYAKGIMEEYVEHPLWSENLWFLWNHLDSGIAQLSDSDTGSFVAPFMDGHGYFKKISAAFQRLDEQFIEARQQAIVDGVEFDGFRPLTKEIKELYYNKWEAPVYKVEESRSPTWHVYTIIAIVIVALIVIVIISIARWRHLRSFYKNGYEPVRGLPQEEIRRLLNGETHSDDSLCSEESDGNNIEHDAAEYTHIDHNADAHTALISIRG